MIYISGNVIEGVGGRLAALCLQKIFTFNYSTFSLFVLVTLFATCVSRLWSIGSSSVHIHSLPLGTLRRSYCCH